MNKLHIKKLYKNNKNINPYIIVSSLFALLLITSLNLYKADVINKEINEAVVSISSTIIFMDGLYYFKDKLKNLEFNNSKPKTLKK